MRYTSLVKKIKNSCSLWYCWREGKHGLQVDLGGYKKIVAWYCDRHAKIADEALKAGDIKTDIPIGEYKGL